MKGVVYYELKPNQIVTAERYQQHFDLNRGLNKKCPIINSKKTQSDFVARQCLTTRCKSS